MNTIHINDVKTEDRVRSCRSQDVIALAKSIEEEGLIHPITITDDNTLIAGGHRLAAFKLLAQKDKKYEQIPFIRFEDHARAVGLIKEGEVVDKAQLKLLELEENIKRKSMTWQETVMGIAKYHNLAKKSPKTVSWTQHNTAALFGVAQSFVSPALRIAKRLENKDDPVWQCENICDAVNLLIKEKKDAVKARLAKQMKVTAQKLDAKVEKQNPLKGISFVDNSDDDDEPVITKSRVYSRDEIEQIYTQGNCLDLLNKFAGKFDHIITDPPYAIEMDNFLGQEAIESVIDTHQVDANLELLPQFIKASRECAKDTSYMCMWYDVVHHEKIIKWAEDAGWIPHRWNVVWCKTSPCVNRTAMYNITKATEVCAIFRASSKAVLAQKRRVNWLLAENFNTSAEHPFGKPSAVWDWLIDTVSFEGQTILDPFAGCGSSIYSIVKKNRIPLAIEVDVNHIANGVNWLHKTLNV